MTREEFTNKILSSKSNNFIIEAATSMGKTKAALDKASQWFTSTSKILIVVPRNVLKDNWRMEINKWGYNNMLSNITFVTYVSLPKVANTWDIIIFDEAHHLTEKCQEALTTGFKAKHILALSATLKKDVKWFLKVYCKYHIEEIVVTLANAIESDTLPEPTIYIIPLTLDNIKYNTTFTKKAKKGIKDSTTINYTDKWKYRGYAGTLNMICTQKQYYNEISGLIEWYKAKSSRPIMKNIWLHKCGERLKWLAEQKTEVIKQILKHFKNVRMLTFCADIEQSNNLGTYCVNSKIGTENLDKFNEKKIKHIAAVGMLDEGITLTDCRVGLFQMLNSSDKLVCQRIGRILRHKKPILILPYYKDTREAEILDDILASYNKESIHVVHNIDELVLK
jgi:superfamily II DNA or RNA helicase